MKVGVALGALVFLLAGCGGVEREPNLAQAVERTQAVGSSRIEVHGVETDNRKQAEVDCSGAADYARKRIRVECEHGTNGRLEMLAVGDDLYMRGELMGVSGADAKWLHFPGEPGEAGDASYQNFSPERLLSMLRAASRQTERVGEEDVRGVSTTKYRLTVDCDAADLECVDAADVEVWIDEDGLVRKIHLVEEGADFTVEFFDFGVQVDIEPPPAEQVAESEFGSSGTTVEPGTKCIDEEEKPISEKPVVNVLQRHGFSVNGDGCGSVSSSPGAGGESILEREGMVFCAVHPKPPEGAPTTVVRRGADGADAELVLQNLECTIFTDSVEGEDKIDRLEEAFAELERAIRP